MTPRGLRRCTWMIVFLQIAASACSGSEDVAVSTADGAPLLSVIAWQLPIETMCIESDESYSYVTETAGGDWVRFVEVTPFTDRLIEAIDRLGRPGPGLAGPSVGESDCDITVEVVTEGTAVAAEYSNTFGLSSVTLYTGWDISGTITVSAADRESLIVIIDEHQIPPEQTQATAADDPSYAIERGEDTSEWCPSFWALFGGRTEDWNRGICV